MSLYLWEGNRWHGTESIRGWCCRLFPAALKRASKRDTSYSWPKKAEYLFQTEQRHSIHSHWPRKHCMTFSLLKLHARRSPCCRELSTSGCRVVTQRRVALWPCDIPTGYRVAPKRVESRPASTSSAAYFADSNRIRARHWTSDFLFFLCCHFDSFQSY